MYIQRAKSGLNLDIILLSNKLTFLMMTAALWMLCCHPVFSLGMLGIYIQSRIVGNVF